MKKRKNTKPKHHYIVNITTLENRPFEVDYQIGIISPVRLNREKIESIIIENIHCGNLNNCNQTTYERDDFIEREVLSIISENHDEIESNASWNKALEYDIGQTIEIDEKVLHDKFYLLTEIMSLLFEKFEIININNKIDVR